MTKQDDGLVAMRNRLWPESTVEVCDPNSRATVGYARIPRVVPMLASLLNTFDKMNCGNLYSVLWSYDRGFGMVEVEDCQTLAVEAGYTPSRAQRAWNERIQLLKDWEVVRTAPRGPHSHGYVLLRNPYLVTLELSEAAPFKQLFSSTWMQIFEQRCRKAAVPLDEVRSTLEVRRGYS
jgi:hypothetical protein